MWGWDWGFGIGDLEGPAAYAFPLFQIPNPESPIPRARQSEYPNCCLNCALNSSKLKRWFCVPGCSTLSEPLRLPMRPMVNQSQPFWMPKIKSDESSVGKECLRTCISRGSPYHYK